RRRRAGSRRAADGADGHEALVRAEQGRTGGHWSPDKAAAKRLFARRPACGGMLRGALALVTMLLLAGCTSAVLNPAALAPDAKALLPQAESLWPDHQNQP